MKEQKLNFSARKLGESGTAYGPLEDFGLKYSYRIAEGNGTFTSPYRCDISITNDRSSRWEGVIHIGMQRRRVDPLVFMPGFMYGTNRGDMPIEGQRLCPKIRENMQKPASPWWMVRGDRLSHPVVLIWDNGHITGFHAAPYWTVQNGEKTACIGREKEFLQYAGFACNAYLKDPESGEMRCEAGYTLGYENAPWLFVQSADVRERAPIDGQCFSIDANESVQFCMYLYDFASEQITDINRVVENVYHFYHEMPAERASVRESVKALAEAVSDDAWLPQKKGYSLFVFQAPESSETEYRELGSFSWTNGLSVAVPMLMSAVRLSNKKMKDQAVCCIQAIVADSLNEHSGLPYDGYMDGRWTLRGWWFDCIKNPGHSGYIVGQGVFYLIKAYEFLKKNTGEEYPAWLEYAEKVIDVLERQRNCDGEYPYILSGHTGAGIEYDSFGSVWCMAAALKYMEVTGKRDWLEAVLKSEEHYYQAYVAKCQCYGGPLDISKGMDSEGILAYIRAAAILHRMTGEEKFLKHLKDGIEYELTFKFSYHTPVSVPPLSKTGWCSCGGSVTSVVNPHIHPMSSSIVDELLYYVNQTGDRYIASRMKDTILWGCQTYNHFDREYDYGKKGWMSERYCYSQGLLTEHYPDGSVASTWFALMPWASASVLEGFVGELWDKEA